ncbi:MAG: universal stress protein, partial [Candidatus Obscuribacterales bacterium]|nr:universal stress protein [Candidatus Obscuribacterales bacterium]
HVVSVMPAYTEPTIMQTYRDYGIQHKLEYDKKKEATQVFVKDFTVKLKKIFPQADITSELLTGEAAAAIIDKGRDWQADLIVVGSHGKGFLSRFVLGSVSNKVLLHSECAVEIVRKRESDSNRTDYNILLPIDFSAHSDKSLADALESFSGKKARFKIIMTIEQIISYFTPEIAPSTALAMMEERQEMIARAKDLLPEKAQPFIEKFENERISVDIVDGSPANEILDLARSWPADLIILGSHGKTGLSKLLLGSVSQAVALNAPCSVRIVK